MLVKQSSMDIGDLGISWGKYPSGASMKFKNQLLMIPGPTNVPDRVIKAMQRPMIDHRGPEFHELYSRLLEDVKYLFQTKGDVFILSCSGTGGIDCVLSNSIKPGDKVIIPTFGTFSKRVKRSVEVLGGRPIDIPIQLGKAVVPSQIEDVLEKEKDVKMIAIVYNETSTGVKVPDLKTIGEIAYEHGALLMVDAISILGGDYLPVDDWKVDLCVTGSQKCLAAPPGLALVSVSDKAWESIKDNPRRLPYFDLVEYKTYAEERMETPYTPSIPLYYALEEAIKMIKEEGLEARIERHKKCANAFYSAIEAMGLEIFPDKRFLSPTVIAVKVPEKVSESELRKRMREDYGVVIAGSVEKELKGLIFRIGSMGIVSEKEVTMTIDALGKSLIKLGFKADLESAISEVRKAFE